MAQPHPNLLLFDLDGTLTDSAPGIFACIRHALRELDLPAPSEPDLRRAVGQRIEVLPIARTAYEEGEMTVTGLLDSARAQLEANLRELELEHLEADAWFRWLYASGQYLGGEEQS